LVFPEFINVKKCEVLFGKKSNLGMRLFENARFEFFDTAQEKRVI
jgi:hypothetical protein